MAEKLAHILKKAVISLLYIGIYGFIQQVLYIIADLCESDRMNYTGVVTTVSAFASVSVFAVIYYLRGKKLSSRIKIRRPVLLDIILSFTLAIGFRMLTTVYFVLADKSELLSKSIENAQSQSYNFNTMTTIGRISILAAIIVIAPIAEEILFRGIVQRELSEAVGIYWAIVLQAILFGCAHGFLVQSVFTTVFGLMLGVLYYKTNNLTVTVLAHVFFNFSSVPQIENYDLWPNLAVMGILLTAVSFLMFVYVYRKTHALNNGAIGGGNNNG